MYFPIGWPKVINVPYSEETSIKQIICNRDRILFAILTDDSIAIWFCKPCVPIVFYRRTPDSLQKFGTNTFVEWKPDSSMMIVATTEGHMLLFDLSVIPESKGLYIQTDSPHASLRRDSAELFIKETIPSLHLSLRQEVMVWDGDITGLVCITMSEFMVSTSRGHVLRYSWDGTQLRDYNFDLRRIPFCINQQVSKAIPIVEENVYIINIDYSPLVGGFSIVLNDGRAAFLTASSLKFDPNQVQGIWAQGIEDATCGVMNHKYRLITFGRKNSECVVYYVDESTGGLEVSHNCVLSSKDYPGDPGSVEKILWTPDGCALVAVWEHGGIAMWSTFGSLLMCSLGWDYGLNIDLQKRNPLQIKSLQFATEGYQLWMVNREPVLSSDDIQNDNMIYRTRLLQLDFMKSSLTINPCMSHQNHLCLQGDDKLYVNSADTLIRIFSERSTKEEGVFVDSTSATSTLIDAKQWLVIPVPSTYSATNWPVRYSAIDSDAQNIVIAGRTGLAHYSMQTRRWKLFGNETQERDFIVLGGLLWWRDYIVIGCYSLLDNADQIRFYHRDSRLDNKFAKIVPVSSPVLLINILHDQLISFGSDNQISIWSIQNDYTSDTFSVNKVQVIDISALSVHPACIVSIALTSLRTESGRGQQINSENIVLNVSGRLLLVQREIQNGEQYTCSMPTVLASCVENVWVPFKRKPEKAHLTEALWLFCGAHGMRVWLPLYPKDGDKGHTFMSKRIMLPFHLKIYPLAILFEDAIILGAENDTVLYSSDSNSPFSIPFSILQRTSQVYLHQILRQLIRRNLGYHAWEIARSCMSLPYFPHSLELLLHEVLEEEATSKEPIPDAQLPSIIEFIMEFPVYLQTVVQCARKTEIALWPYLFSAAGKPKDLFQECMAKRQLDTAASYLIILQNLEASSVSRQYATLLLNAALDKSKWELAKDLVRFLRAIDPNDVESPRTSFILPPKLGISQQTPPVSPNVDDLSLILGNVQGSRVRSYSTTISPKLSENKSNSNTYNSHSTESPQSARKKSVPNTTGLSKQETRGSLNNTAEEFFIDIILQKHARRLLSTHRLGDLGYFAAHLDFHLVTWLAKERERAARIDDFVQALKQLHAEFSWPYPVATLLPMQNNSTETMYISPEDRLKLLKIEVNDGITSSHVGDSGYMSFEGLPCKGLITPVNTLESMSQITESELSQTNVDNDNNKITEKCGTETDPSLYNNNFCKNEICNMDEKTLEYQSRERTDTVMSTISSTWGDDGDATTSTNWEVPSSQILEQLANIDNKGSNRSEVRLRYLLQLFMEAGCLEWSLIISILLRDAMAVLRTVNSAKSLDHSREAVSRLRQGLIFIHYWTSTQCLGYQAFMLAIQNQISVLAKILEMKKQEEKTESQQVLTASLNANPSVPNRPTNEPLSQSGVSIKEKNSLAGNQTPKYEKVVRNDDAKMQNQVSENSACVIS